jgi:hypothetical protein
MDLARRWTATAVAFAAVTATAVGLAGSPAGAAPKPADPEKVQAKGHDRKVCDEKKAEHASCMARVIARSETDPTPLYDPSPSGASPATIKAAYGFPTSPTAGAGQTIAIISAYDSPTVQADLTHFSNTFGLPCNACLTKVNQTGGTTYPAYNALWALESNLDTQWVHAIAPGAKILLVEATTNSYVNLMAAVDYAKTRANYVTMSWGTAEFANQLSYDSRFVAPGVTFFAAAGDEGLPARYPSASPNVVSVGGTTLEGLGTANVTETAWSNGGGGCSVYEKASPAQKAFSQYSQSGCKQGARATPDVSMVGDSWKSGVSIYLGSPAASAGWTKVAGTSLSAPVFAARAAVAGGMMDSAKIYGAGAPKLRDITSGNNGAPAKVGYDMASGRGSWSDAPATAPPTTPTTPPTTPTTPPATGITNGGLEAGNLSSWTPSGAVAAIPGNAHGGTYSAQAGAIIASNGDSTVAQTFTAPAGGTTVSFWYKQTCNDPVTEGWATATLRDNATGAVTTVLPRTCATGVYQRVTSSITGGRSYTLSLTNHDDNVADEATYTNFDSVMSY